MGDLLVCLVTKSCPTLCKPMDCSPPCSSVHGISQTRTLEWVAISFCRGSSWLRDQIQVSWIAYGFFTNWTTREALGSLFSKLSITLKKVVSETKVSWRHLIEDCGQRAGGWDREWSGQKGAGLSHCLSLGSTGLPQELYQTCFRAACLSGEAGTPISSSFTLGVHTPALLVPHGRAPRRGPGVLLLQQVCPRALCGVWEVRVRTPGGAHVSAAGRAAPTLRLAWGLSWVRLKRAQGAARGGSAQLHPPFIINLLLYSVGLASLSPPSKFHLEDQENLHPSLIFSSPLITGFQQQCSPELKVISPGPMYLPPLWASGCYPHVQTVPRDVDFSRKTRMILEGKRSAISIKGPFQLWHFLAGVTYTLPSDLSWGVCCLVSFCQYAALPLPPPSFSLFVAVSRNLCLSFLFWVFQGATLIFWVIFSGPLYLLYLETIYFLKAHPI